MSKMKQLLRKLHIGGSGGGGGGTAAVNHHHQQQTRPESNRSPSPSTESSTNSSNSRIATVDSGGGDRAATDNSSSSNNNNSNSSVGVDFSYLEEEFQVQLALAMSASDPSPVDPESAQIDAAKRVSLACCPVAATESTNNATRACVDSLSLRYWCYSVVGYDEKVMDGFYDVYGITSNSVIQGKMPLFVDLQALSISENVNCEVTLVNRFVDPELRELEKQAYIASLEIQASDGLILSGLIQKLADIVVDRMGGPVSDADEIFSKWSRRSYELRYTLHTIILPIGRLDVGLSRHRALLFKVLADKINLPCMLVKGSYYTGTDDGAINLVKFDDGSEYIIDLMGAPGALIPAEVPSSHISSAGFDLRGFCGRSDIPGDLSPPLVEGPAVLAVPPSIQTSSSVPEDAQVLGVQTNRVNSDHALFCHSDELLSGHEQSLLALREEASRNNIRCGYEQKQSVGWAAEKEKGLETNALRSEISLPSARTSEGFVLVDNRTDGKLQNGASRVSMALGNSPGILGTGLQENRFHESSSHPAMNSCQIQVEDNLADDTDFNIQDKNDLIFGMETDDESGLHLGPPLAHDGYNYKIYPELGEVAEWEIPWEDLLIHDRIGIGSCGEVYHADWNGTEVAVKKFLDQDLSGDALVQFKYEAEIMIKLRHPNIVLFMGAVTRPPHLSILTEYLPRGSLYKILHQFPRPDERRRIKMALDVAKGMNYLHTSHPVIVHRDLKTPNLLVDRNWVVKVSDFGLSRMKHHTFLSSKSTSGTPEWMAPEVLRNEPANEKCDVFSFGVILWELVTCDIPWKTINPMQVVGAVGFQNRRLDVQANTDPVVAQIIRDCWELDPHLRPSFSQIITRLRCVRRLELNE